MISRSFSLLVTVQIHFSISSQVNSVQAQDNQLTYNWVFILHLTQPNFDPQENNQHNYMCESLQITHSAAYGLKSYKL